MDKTEQVYRLAVNGKFYSLSRPRRFGKSLLLSTMEAYFLGRKDLFEGLAIAELETEWTEHPVLRIDLGGRSYDREDVLSQTLDNFLSRWEKQFGVDNNSDVPGLRFGNVIDAAHARTGKQVVILIDEYDKPFLSGGKEIIRIGINFCSETRRIEGWKAERS